jgi:hypothetical protein
LGIYTRDMYRNFGILRHDAGKKWRQRKSVARQRFGKHVNTNCSNAFVREYNDSVSKDFSFVILQSGGHSWSSKEWSESWTVIDRELLQLVVTVNKRQ